MVLIPAREQLIGYKYLEKAMRKAHHYNYEGDWIKVAELASARTTTSIYTLAGIVEWLQQNFHENDIIGNIVPKVNYYLWHCKVSDDNRKNTSKVNYPQRKRGYSDKGSLRPETKWLPQDYSEEEINYQREKLGKSKIKKRKPLIEVTPPSRRVYWIRNKGADR